VAPGKEERAGAHRNGGSMARRCKRCRPAVFNGGGVAPVVVDEGGWVLQLEGDLRVWRRRSIEGKSSSEGRSPEGGTAVMLGRSPARRRGSGGVKPARRTPGRCERRRGARAWTDETNSARGEKNLRLAGDGSVLTGSGGEGARRGGHHVEAERKREREREGPWARRGAARRRVVGAARAGGALPRDSGGRWGRRDTVDVADRWGRQHSVLDSVFKPNQTDFKRIQICSKL
jgi:hypothetical protein